MSEPAEGGSPVKSTPSLSIYIRPEDRERIADAARATHQPPSTFVRRAALQEADRVLAAKKRGRR